MKEGRKEEEAQPCLSVQCRRQGLVNGKRLGAVED